MPAGTILGTVTSDSSGEAVFTGVPPTGQLCISAPYILGTQEQIVAGCHSQPYPATATLNFTI
jgi:hypothetical protein